LLDPDFKEWTPTNIVIDISTDKYEFGSAENQNGLARPYMEDTHFVITEFENHPGAFLVGVFDGHGGFAVSEKAVQNFPNIFLKHVELTESNIVQAFADAFYELDSKFQRYLYVGSTACVAYYDGSTLYTANIGDSRAVLVSGSTAMRLTTDHKHTIRTELDRVLKSGAHISDSGHYVVLPNTHGLAMTRSLGDFGFKQGVYGKTAVISLPEVCVFQHIVMEDTMLVVASDGLWDEFDEDRLVDILAPMRGKMAMGSSNQKRRHSFSDNRSTFSKNTPPVLQRDLSSASIASRLVDAALDNGSRDNTTVIIVRFK